MTTDSILEFSLESVVPFWRYRRLRPTRSLPSNYLMWWSKMLTHYEFVWLVIIPRLTAGISISLLKSNSMRHMLVKRPQHSLNLSDPQAHTGAAEPWQLKTCQNRYHLNNIATSSAFNVQQWVINANLPVIKFLTSNCSSSLWYSNIPM